MTPIKCIRKTFSDKIKQRYCEQGCRMGFKNIRNRVVLKGELLTADRICDCIFFHKEDKLIVSVIELKSKNFSVKKVVTQLNNGAKKAKEILKICKNTETDINFYPILACKSIPSASVNKVLNRSKIIFNRVKYLVIKVRCGTQFSEVLRLYG